MQQPLSNDPSKTDESITDTSQPLSHRLHTGLNRFSLGLAITCQLIKISCVPGR